MYLHRRTANVLSSLNVISCATVAVSVATHISQQIQLQTHDSSIRTNRANGLAVFEGSPIRYNIAYFYI